MNLVLFRSLVGIILISVMENSEEKVIHDHDYCMTKERGDDAVESVEKNQELSMAKSLCLSPTLSSDSGIDSFACDLVNEFGREGDDLLNLLLDDEPCLELNIREGNGGNDKTPEVPRSLPPTSMSGKTVTSKLTIAEERKRNAEKARENRKNKKIYLHGLEKEVAQLRLEKTALTGKSLRLERRVNELQEEVDYLNSIVANQSMLSKLLERVSVTPGISLSTSFCSSRQPTQADSESQKENTACTRRSRKRGCTSQEFQKSNQETANNKKRRKGGSGGVCLHVKENKVSLEFCHKCSKKAED